MAEYFDNHWLALREPADHAARPVSLITQLTAALPQHEPLRIVDLGAGTGSNLRYLAARLPCTQQWLLLDHDAGLLNHAVSKTRIHDHLRVETRTQDLTAWPLPLADADLVTAAALLDLVTDDWLSRLADACAEWQLPALLALNYDGRVDMTPAHPADALIIAAVNAHQQSEKAMGQALGPNATEAARQQFLARGYRVTVLSSDWQLAAEQSDLQQALLRGWHEAACIQRTDLIRTFDEWLEARLAMTAESQIRVGHQDVLAIP